MATQTTVKIVVLVLLALLVIGSVLFVLAKKRLSVRETSGAGLALREMFLTLSPQDAGVTPPDTPLGVWAAAMDLSFANGTATLVTTIDGAASLYYSSGGGVIGGEAHDQVRAAAARFVAAVEQCSPHLPCGKPEALPAAGHVRFYAHSRSGLLRSAEVFHQMQNAKAYGLAATGVTAELAAVVARSRGNRRG